MVKKFFVIILACFNIVVIVAGFQKNEQPTAPHNQHIAQVHHGLPRTSPQWEKAAREAIPKVLSEYGENIKEAARAYHISPRLITAILIVESMGDPFAKSSAGAMGCMQTLPTTDADMGVTGDSFDCPTSIWKGTKYLAHLRDNTNLTPRHKIIAAYERGPEGVRDYSEQDLMESDYLNKVTFVVEHLPKNF